VLDFLALFALRAEVIRSDPEHGISSAFGVTRAGNGAFGSSNGGDGLAKLSIGLFVVMVHLLV
jgi:hypothetical protein